MSYEFLFIALMAVSVFSSLTVEAVKKLLNEKGVKYAPNLLAAIVSVVFTVAACVCYIIFTGEIVNAKVIVEVIVLAFMSFLVATVGYDKVIQAIAQIKRG